MDRDWYEAVLRLLPEQLRPLRGQMSVFAPRLARALDQADWALASKTLWIWWQSRPSYPTALRRDRRR
jgi:hypothetical protein